jgi:RNA polymerase sigma-70 factor (ECF subfamily)
MERSYDRIFALSFRLTGRRAEAEDLTQDICTKLPVKITSYKARAQFSTWLYRVIVNAAHDQRRRLARQETLSLDWGDWELARPAENQTAAADSDWLFSAMQSLSTELRDTLALVLDDVSHKDAAQILGVSQGTISWRVADAKARLRGLRAREQTR